MTLWTFALIVFGIYLLNDHPIIGATLLMGACNGG